MNKPELLIHLTEAEEVKALPILLRHSPGVILANRVYIVQRSALRALQDAGICFDIHLDDSDTKKQGTGDESGTSKK